jgi:hypothetical protein
MTILTNGLNTIRLSYNIEWHDIIDYNIYFGPRIVKMSYGFMNTEKK